MNSLSLLGSSTYYMEIGLDLVKVIGAQGGLELSVERQPTGRFTPDCKEKLSLSFQEFLKRKNWQTRPRVVCALSARGVSLRRITLPGSNKENLDRLLLLQIESEFPLSPDELAWGYIALSEPGSRLNGSAGKQDYLVVAVRKEVVEEWSDLLSGAGVNPVFTLAALARSKICLGPSETCMMLDIGPKRSELVSFVDGVATAIRILPWGNDEVMHEGSLDFSTVGLNGKWRDQKLYLSATGRSPALLAPRLTERLGEGIQFEMLDSGTASGSSAAILGLKKASEHNTPLPWLGLKAKPAEGSHRLPQGINWKSARLPVALVLLLLCLPFVEALLLKPLLSRKLTRLKADQVRLTIIDRELGFLQYLKQSQSPYLDAIYVLSKASPPGAHIDSLSMNHRGELSLRISMREPNQVLDFRSKLIDSGFFSNVAIEEQAPSPDRQKLNVRLSAQWKSASARQGLATGPTPQEIEKAKNSKPSLPGPPLGFPGGSPVVVPPLMTPTPETGPANLTAPASPSAKPPSKSLGPRSSGGSK